MAGVPYLVGIAGGSGSGKTSLIRSLCNRLPPGSVSTLSQDDYYHPMERQVADASGRINFDLPTSVDLDALAADLRDIRAGRTVRRAEYTFNNAAREAGWVETAPAPIVLVEGLFVLHHEGVREAFDLRVFVDAPIDLQLQRRLRRDAEERGYGAEDVTYQWHHHVLPAYHAYLLDHRHRCEVEVRNHEDLDEAVGALRRSILARIPTLGPLALHMA